MTEILPILAAYGLPGAVLALIGFLLWRLIERGVDIGIDFRVPAKQEQEAPPQTPPRRRRRGA